MTSNFKNIHLGQFINTRVAECEIEITRICNFFRCSEEEIRTMYLQEDLSAHILLKWSKLLDYDFFRIYSQHLILYAPQGSINYCRLKENNKTKLPQFRKKIYTKEIIDFIIELINTKEKTRKQVIEEYRIPKTTLYKWIDKYSKVDG